MPLREVRLKNFKSVREANVELRPLTAIVGRNSSGKSTLVQGILALAQAVRREVSSQSFPLNGDFVRLGTFDEVRNFDVIAEAGIDVGFTAEIDFWTPAIELERGAERRHVGTLVDWTAHLAGSADESQAGQALLDTIEFEVRTEGDEPVGPHVSLRVSAISPDVDPNLPAAPQTAFFNRFGMEVAIDGRVTDERTRIGSSVDLMVMSGGLPMRVYKKGARFDVLFRHWWGFAEDRTEDDRAEVRRWLAERLENDDPAIREQARVELDSDIDWALGFAYECFTSEERPERDSFTRRRFVQGRRLGMPGAPTAELARFDYFIERLEVDDRTRLAGAMRDVGTERFRARLRERLESAGIEWLDDLVRDEPVSDALQALEQATVETHELFRKVHYLGPLRAKPEAMYSAGGGHADLGAEGQHTASYLHSNARQRTLVPRPEGGVEWMTLGEGLNLWLEELGLADTAQARDQGRLGIGLYVQPVGRTQSVDLTSVGVGVSQALPVILQCLLAQRDSIVLLEQPELHLHPAMQLRLADFLLACARTGRQIVVETHSEHLINRLRRRVVEDESGMTGDVVRLLFAEQDNGETVYRISDINEMGGLDEDWPAGFLDVAADESTRLLEQTLARRRAKTSTES